jgi:hypothetical protein
VKARRKEPTKKTYRHKCEDNIKVNLTEMRWSGMYRIVLADDRE